ncbi:MAG: hypothetical protein LLG97_17180 [Deltaproteobacteria bacterium]|nr:hypothetical protein [Deltaproteobacteria bacterium]
MKETDEGEAPANTVAESKLGKRVRVIVGVIFGLGFLFLILKMAVKRFG